MIYESKFISLISKDKILMLITKAPCPDKKKIITYGMNIHYTIISPWKVI